MERKEQAEYYTPDVRVEKPLVLDKELLTRSSKSKLPEVIKVRLKESAVAHQVAIGLYKNSTAGFREVYSNECRAAREAQMSYKANPRIEITLDPKTRILTVAGIDSLGITSSVFVDVLRWMGRTTNNQADEVGQFGWGFFAVFALADELTLETYARETGERYGVSADTATSFKPLSDHEVSIKEYGTIIQMTLKQTIKLEQLVKWIQRNCKYSDIETYLTVSSADVAKEVTLNDIFDPWGNVYGKRKARERIDGTFTQQLYRDAAQHGNAVVYEAEIDSPDYYFLGVIAGNDDTVYSYRTTGDLLLLRVPIESDEAKPLRDTFPFTSWVLNIKNERKFQPTPDRDRFVQGALKTVVEELQKKLTKKLKQDFNIATFNDYRASRWKGIYGKTGDERIYRFMAPETTQLGELLNVECISPDMPVDAENEEQDYYARRSREWLTRHHRNVHAYEIGPLRKLVARSSHLFYSPRRQTMKGQPVIPAHKMRIQQAILRTVYPDAAVFCLNIDDDKETRPAKQRTETTTTIISRLCKQGVAYAEDEVKRIKKQLGKDWRTKCGLPPLVKEQKRIADWVIHGRLEDPYSYRVGTKRVKPDTIPSNIIRIPGNLGPYLNALKEIETTYGLTKNHPALKGGIMLDQLLNSLKSKTVPTAAGPITFADIANAPRQATIYLTDKTEIVHHYTPPKGELMTTANRDTAFELMTFLTAKKKTFTTILCPDADTFERKAGVDLETIAGKYIDEASAARATTAYLGAIQIHTPELRELFLHAVKETYQPDEADEYMKAAFELDQTPTQTTQAAA